MQKIIIIFILLTLFSCKSVIDYNENDSIKASGFSFQYNKDHNKFLYYNNINGVAENQIFYNTHFEIKLPKGIINWSARRHDFIFEYNNKQIIYVYVPYKNEGIESNHWELKDIDYHDALNLGEYWEERKYKENHLYKEHPKRISKIYTNGKYIIMLYNIKDINYPKFVQSVKTFKLIQ